MTAIRCLVVPVGSDGAAHRYDRGGSTPNNPLTNLYSFDAFQQLAKASSRIAV